MYRPIVKIVPIPTEGGFTDYRIEIPEQEGLLNVRDAQEFIKHLQRAIDVVNKAAK